MKNISANKSLLVLGLFLFTSPLFAQATENVMISPGINFTPQFFVCVIAGIILAMGFQSLLTLLSVASGISIVGNLEEPAKKKENDIHAYQEKKNKTPFMVMVTSAMGVWTVLTASVSLFFASLISIKLSLIPNNGVGMALGLVIWAAFFGIIMYLEIRSVSSLIGGVFNTALQGIRSGFNAFGYVLGKSPEDKAAMVAQSTVSTLRKEIAHAMDDSKVTKKISKYLDKFEPKEFDYEKMKREFLKMFKDIEIVEAKGILGFDKKTVIRLAEKKSFLSRSNVKKIAEVAASAWAISKIGRNSDKVLALVDQFTPGHEGESKKFREKVEDYLRSIEKEELNPDRLKEDLEGIIHDPSSTIDIVKNRISQMNRETLFAAISKRKDLSPEEAERITGYVERAVGFVKDKFGPRKEGDKEYKSLDDIEGSNGWRYKLEEKISDYLDSLERPELNYEAIKSDFQTIFSDPKSTFSVLKNRLSLFDRQTLIALLSSRENVSAEDAERMISKIEDARDNALRKAEEIEKEAQRKWNDAKVFALHQAEAMRKTAATAAWWMVATIVISGVASALGGIFALSM